MSDQPARMKEPEASDIAWGCAEIAKRSAAPNAKHSICSKGYLPVAKVGGHWVGSRRRLRKHVGAQVE